LWCSSGGENNQVRKLEFLTFNTMVIYILGVESRSNACYYHGSTCIFTIPCLVSVYRSCPTKARTPKVCVRIHVHVHTLLSNHLVLLGLQLCLAKGASSRQRRPLAWPKSAHFLYASCLGTSSSWFTHSSYFTLVVIL